MTPALALAVAPDVFEDVPQPDGPPRTGGQVHLVLVEDHPADAFLVETMLTDELGSRLELRHFECLADFDEDAAEWADCVLLDLTLPDAHGLDGFYEVRSRAPDTALVVLSGSQDERLAMGAMHAGAQDYLLKGRVDAYSLGRAIAYARERKAFEIELLRRALHDPLTGLPNRRLFEERVRSVLSRAEPGAGLGAALFLDLDDFKTLNDSHGHVVGDQLLKVVADRILSVLRPEDTAARFGGDEFVVLLERSHTTVEALAVADRLQRAIAVPIELAIGELFVRVSIGVTMLDAADGVVDVLRKADAAMYLGKQGSGPALFDARLSHAAAKRLDSENELHRAVAQHDFTVFYQPIVSLQTGSVVGAEALVRWQHAERGIVMPGEFIALAESTGLIVAIGDQVMTEACNAGALWPAGHAPGTKLSVNLSVRQLAEPNVQGWIANVVAQSGLPPDQVCLELTESLLLEDLDVALGVLSSLRAVGVHLAIDDFGTGYSSMSYLKRLPVDVLKIDRSLVAGLGESAADEAIVNAVITIGHSLGMTVVAEGIERQEQWDQLAELGCDQAQGYLIGRPCRETEFVGLLTPRTE